MSRISIVTPSFNQALFLGRTIESVLRQPLTDVEHLVMDGGSTDGTLDVLRGYGSRIQWVSEPDRGQAHAVNKGIIRSTGDIIGWLNSDDTYAEDALPTVREYFLRHPEVDAVYGEADFINVDDRVIEFYYTEAWDPKRLETVCFICQPALFMRRRVVDRIGLLDERLQYAMDYEYWLRMAKHNVNVTHVPTKLANSRLYATNKTLGSRTKVCREINDMMRRTNGYVPDHWIITYSHAVLETRGFTYESAPLRFACAASVMCWISSLRWNRGVSRGIRALTRHWVVGNLRIKWSSLRKRPTG